MWYVANGPSFNNGASVMVGAVEAQMRTLPRWPFRIMLPDYRVRWWL